jgi:hypothetical protein
MALLASTYDVSKYFNATDLQKPKRLKIKKVTEEMVGPGAEKTKKLVVWFVGDTHGLVLNRINNRSIRGKYGDDTAGWVGKVIELYPTQVEYNSTPSPAIRVRTAPPKQDGNNGQAVEPEPAGESKSATVQQPSPAEDSTDTWA